MSKVIRIGETPPIQRDITTRNLIYHVYAHKQNPAWVANLKQIKRRWGLFNGRKIISVAIDRDTYRSSDVRRFLGDDAEYLEVRNDPVLRETVSFPLLLSIIKSYRPDEATFYAHAKGSSPTRRDAMEKPEGIMYWRNSMYHRNLDDWPLVHRNLVKYPMVGIFKINWSTWKVDQFGWNFYPSGLYSGEWMFAGTFFWFRHDATFANPYAMHPADDNYGVEAWPARLWPPEMGCTIHQPWDEHLAPNPNVYTPQVFDPSKGWDRIADE